jgi:hypothetical protein
VGKPEGKIPLGRPRRMWENNIKMGLRGMGCGGTYCIDREQWRAFLKAVINRKVI